MTVEMPPAPAGYSCPASILEVGKELTHVKLAPLAVQVVPQIITQGRVTTPPKYEEEGRDETDEQSQWWFHNRPLDPPPPPPPPNQHQGPRGDSPLPQLLWLLPVSPQSWPSPRAGTSLVPELNIKSHVFMYGRSQTVNLLYNRGYLVMARTNGLCIPLLSYMAMGYSIAPIATTRW
jgi:hypothetical protein